jgi:hypothetical protein
MKKSKKWKDEKVKEWKRGGEVAAPQRSLRRNPRAERGIAVLGPRFK